jgi:hypothetical protein
VSTRRESNYVPLDTLYRTALYKPFEVEQRRKEMLHVLCGVLLRLCFIQVVIATSNWKREYACSLCSKCNHLFKGLHIYSICYFHLQLLPGYIFFYCTVFHNKFTKALRICNIHQHYFKCYNFGKAEKFHSLFKGLLFLTRDIVLIHTHIYVHKYIYTYMHTHTYIHTHTYVHK